jgi:hypothetical protein
MNKELITEASVEALVNDMSERDRKALAMYTHIMLMAFANKDNYKVAFIFENESTTGIAAINMTEMEVVGAIEEAHENMCHMITKDMPSKEMFN